MKCKICNANSTLYFNKTILLKYNVSYYQCELCGFLQTEEPYWLEEAYNEPINISDTGYIVRNIFYVKKLTIFLFFFFYNCKEAKFIDYAGGYGVFTRMMRDIGFNYYWDDKYTKNFFASGFEGDLNERYSAVTTFESFEHFVYPITEIEKLVNLSDNIIFSTELIEVPPPEKWWYYGIEHGQHISFYTKKTLQYIAQKYHLFLNSSGSLHFLTKNRIPLWLIIALKFTRFSLQNIIISRVKSKTWEDHELLARNVRNI